MTAVCIFSYQSSFFLACSCLLSALLKNTAEVRFEVAIVGFHADSAMKAGIATRESGYMRYSGFKVIKEALTGHKGWTPAWRDPEPRPHYDIVIIGGGGHGLATAHYLAKDLRQKKIAVIEKGWIGGGNVGATPRSSARTICWMATSRFMNSRSNFGKGLEQDFNYNAMISQRGILNLIHPTPSAMRLRGAAMP